MISLLGMPILFGSMNATSSTIVFGWHNQPNSRGTFDIIKTCAGTMFLLCWSSVCPNVPSPDSGVIARFVMKFHLFLLAILGPDFIFMVAVGQLNAAWRARKAFRQEGSAGWSLRHCFFVNMGGLHLNFRDRKLAGLPSFPIDCEQMLHLVRNKYMALPEIEREDINDRNKSDQLARAITVVQVSWFTLSVLGRAAQGLFITTLELTTLAFAVLMAGCAACWWHKPMDVSQPMTIDVDTDLSTILQEAAAPIPPRGRTPLSFLNRREWFLSQSWASYVQILRNVKLLRRSTEPAQAAHFPSVDFPETEFAWDCAFGWLIPAYSAIFMAGWNFYYPTTIEQTLWRVSAVTCLTYGLLGSLVAGSWHHQAFAVRWSHRIAASLHLTRAADNPTKPGITRGGAKGKSTLVKVRQRFNSWFSGIRNFSPDHDPDLEMPARLWLLTTALCIAYCFLRAFILVEDVIALRALPQSAFQTVSWSQYSPVL